MFDELPNSFITYYLIGIFINLILLSYIVRDELKSRSLVFKHSNWSSLDLIIYAAFILSSFIGTMILMISSVMMLFKEGVLYCKDFLRRVKIK